MWPGLPWSPAGDKIVTACSDESLYVWDAESGKQISRLQGHVGDVASVARTLSATEVTSDVNSVPRFPGHEIAHGAAGMGNQAPMMASGSNLFTSESHDTYDNIHTDIRDTFRYFAFDFDRIDRNRDGWLSADHLHCGLLSTGWEQDEVCGLFDIIDNDDRITKAEFIIACRALKKHRSVT